MTSRLTPDFIACFRALPERIQQLARKNYRLWKQNPSHPGLEFKQVSRKMPVYSVRVGIGWRALGIRQGNDMLWFWIGSHAEYDRMLRAL